jgi:hypothetical protein
MGLVSFSEPKPVFEFGQIGTIVNGITNATIRIPFCRKFGVFNVFPAEIVAPESSTQAYILAALVIVLGKHDQSDVRYLY